MYEARQNKECVSRKLSQPKRKSEQLFVLLPISQTLQMTIGHVAQFGKSRKQRGRSKGTHKKNVSSGFDTLSEIYSRFVLKEDAEQIAQYTIEKNCAISIRETGDASLARLRDRAGTKPHTILDKSFKAKTAPLIAVGMNLDHTDSQNALEVVLRKLKLPMEMVGHVPHWNSPNTIDGFYLTSKGWRYCKGDKKLRPKMKDQYLSMKGCRHLIQKNKSWHECFMTGDYDVHDIAKFSKFNRSDQKKEGENYPRIPKASDIHFHEKKGDTGMLRDMNERMRYDKDQQRFQHGAQVNYIYFAQDMGEDIIDSLMYPDFPIAMCSRGTWSIIRNEKDLQGWYEEMELPYIWQKNS